MRRWLGVAMGLAALAACTLSNPGPGATVERFVRAMDAGDFAEVRRLLLPQKTRWLEDLEAIAADRRPPRRVKSVKILEESINGEGAKVRFAVTLGDGSTIRESLTLKKAEGRWLIDETPAQGGATPQ